MGAEIDVDNNYKDEKNLKDYPKSFPISTLKIIENQSKNSICKIDLKPKGSATGFLCKIPFPTSYNLLPVLITNNHVLNKNDILR